MERPELNSAVREDLVRYIEYLEDVLGGVDELSKALMYASGIIAGDIYSLCDGTAYEVTLSGGDTIPGMKSNLIILRGDPKDKTFDQLMDVFNNFGNKIMALSQKSKPTAVDTKGKIPVKTGGNPFEHVIRDIKNNGNPKNRPL